MIINASKTHVNHVIDLSKIFFQLNYERTLASNDHTHPLMLTFP